MKINENKFLFKIFTFFIIFTVFLFSVLLSCKSEKSSISESNEKINEKTEENIKQDQSIFEILPPNDFNGDLFRIYIPPNPDSPVDKGTFAEEITGEAFNDTVYNRNRKVEDQYNVKINPVYGNSWDSTYADLKKDVNAGDLRAEVYFTHVINGVASMASDGLLQVWDAVPHLDFFSPWWNQTIIKNLNIAGKTFYTAGSMSIQEPLVLLFNKTLIQALALPDPYKLVREGKWTIDKLNEMAVLGLKDLNGDGKFEKTDDQFGLEYGIQWQTPALMYACDEISVVLDENGYPNIEIDNQKKIDAYEKLYNLLWEGDKTYCYVGNTAATANIPHIGIDSGRVLFVQWNLFSCEKLRAAEVEYGILPLPKYDEKQEKYFSNSWTGMYGLPVCIPENKLEMIGLVMESMSALGYYEVIPVYYDNLLKEKVSRDEDSREMLDIILGGMVFDLGLNFQTGSSQPGFFVNELLKSKNKNYISAVEKQKEKIISDYDKLYKKIAGIGD